MPEIYIGNTDNKWFDFLRTRQPWAEVNFWKPTPATFKAIDEGGLFAFRLKSPRAFIGGYGILASAINVPIQFAWDGLGIGNGCATVDELVSSIKKYRGGIDITAQSLFGCRVLIEPVFFDEADWFPVPDDWSDNIVSGKTYSTNSNAGELLYQRILERTDKKALFQRDKQGLFGFGDDGQKPLSPLLPTKDKYGRDQFFKPRLGQQSFRIKVASAYQFTCGISDTKVLPALDAAHVRPYADGGIHALDNGIMLRKDIHSVFDAGYATFDEDFRFVVSDRVRTDFNNGNEYRKLHGSRLKLPSQEWARPAKVNIEWHRNERFKG